ncbi:MAG: ADP-heptose:LPS heptosyltransferase [Oceanospirillaceae bacterium]|jgi:ADP-heptose:LPS heptosyltransferase
MINIVIISQNRPFFGAQIVHIPLLRLIKSRYPGCKIHFFSKSKVSNILLSLGIIDTLIIEKSKLHFLQEYKAISAELTVNLRKKSLWHFWVMVMMNRGIKVGFSTFLSNIFFDNTAQNNLGIYRANNYLSLFDAKIEPDKIAKNNRVCLIPGAGNQYKVWDLENYICVANAIQLKHPNIEIVFILGQQEAAFKDRLSEFTVQMNIDIKQLFSCIGESILVISNDCGPSHIGHILGVDMVSIFSDEFLNAQTTADEWYYKREGAYLIQGDPQQSINSVTVDTVLDKVLKIIS